MGEGRRPLRKGSWAGPEITDKEKAGQAEGQLKEAGQVAGDRRGWGHLDSEGRGWGVACGCLGSASKLVKGLRQQVTAALQRGEEHAGERGQVLAISALGTG